MTSRIQVRGLKSKHHTMMNTYQNLTPEFCESLLYSMFSAAVEAAQPRNNLAEFLPSKPRGRTIVVGAGKASAAMAVSVEEYWTHELTGLVAVPRGATLSCSQIEIIETRHPVPDEASEDASRRILDMVEDLTNDDLVLALLSGGGSSLLSCAGAGLTLQDKQTVNAKLLSSGATIREMNVVRKHLSGIKGGKLAAAAYPAKVVTLLVSDVPGDDCASIASGPTVPDTSTNAEAIDIINRYGLELSQSVLKFLRSSESNTVRPSDYRMQNLTTELICTPQKSLEAAARVAERFGFATMILGDAIEGEAREVGKVLSGITQQIMKYDQPITAPAVLISGGETTVSISSEGGRGGRNTECLLGFAEALGKTHRVYAIACDTDGIDGSEKNAGAIWTPQLQEVAADQRLRPNSFLERNDAWSFFNLVDGLVNTGATHTNVNDFRAILVVPSV